MNIPESNLRNMLNSISSLNHVLNETLVICKKQESDCPSCSYDPVRGESTDPYCDSCDGLGKISNDVLYSIPSSIETEEDFMYHYERVGRITEGEILATIDSKEIVEVLNSDGSFNMNSQPDIKKFLDQFAYFEWKGARYVLKSYQVGYLQGNFYEIQIKLTMKE